MSPRRRLARRLKRLRQTMRRQHVHALGCVLCTDSLDLEYIREILAEWKAMLREHGSLRNAVKAEHGSLTK